jgi:tRNA A37 threonylcarbamoyladenosine modification protein TsaB
MKKYVLSINTVLDENKKVRVSLSRNGSVVCSLAASAERKQSEKLLPLVKRLLEKAGAKKDEIKEIAVENRGGSFTASRIGIATANAFGYALGIPVRGAGDNKKTGVKKSGYSIVLPEYSGEPNIGRK